jgi:hypothetical protein
MNRHTLAFALATSLAMGMLPALAQSTDKGRAVAKAGGKQAPQTGEIRIGEKGPEEAPFVSTLTRAERKAKTREAIAKGEIVLRGEAEPPGIPAKINKNSGRTRAEVKAEARAANKAGATRAGEAYPGKIR